MSWPPPAVGIGEIVEIVPVLRPTSECRGWEPGSVDVGRRHVL
jgi:hypothetical protein